MATQVKEKAARKKPSRRGRRNPIPGIIGLLMPFVAGFGLGALDGAGPNWWRGLSGKAKALVLVALAVVARRKKHLELYGAAMALAGRCLGENLLGGRAAPGPDVKDLEDAADAEMEEVDEEIADLEEELVEQLEDAGAVGALSNDGDDDIGRIYDELRDVEDEYADAA